jgi:hypothetical protein
MMSVCASLADPASSEQRVYGTLVDQSDFLTLDDSTRKQRGDPSLSLAPVRQAVSPVAVGYSPLLSSYHCVATLLSPPLDQILLIIPNVGRLYEVLPPSVKRHVAGGRDHRDGPQRHRCLPDTLLLPHSSPSSHCVGDLCSGHRRGGDCSRRPCRSHDPCSIDPSRRMSFISSVRTFWWQSRGREGKWGSSKVETGETGAPGVPGHA